jgi:hypothetical protein
MSEPLYGVMLTAAGPLARLSAGWAFFVVRTEPRWPLPLEPGAPPPRLDVTYTGVINPEVSPHGLSLAVTV